MYILDHPEFLHLLWFLPVVILLYWFWWIRRKKVLDIIPKKKLRKLVFSQYSKLNSFVKFGLLLLTLVFAVWAMANPKAGFQTQKIKRKGVDIVFALDISKSMEAEDVAPNRLSKAKNIISNILAILNMDRVGLIIYAGSAYPLVPMTTDYGALKNFLNSVDTDLISSQGTAINSAIATANDFFKLDTIYAKNKILVLLTDGEDHFSFDSEQMVPLRKDVKVFSVGIGTLNGGPIPVKNYGGVKLYKKDRQGHTVISKLEPKGIEKLANITKGVFISSDNSKEITGYFKKFVNKIEKGESEELEMTDYRYQYQPLLLIAIVLLVIESVLFTKKSKWFFKKKL